MPQLENVRIVIRPGLRKSNIAWDAVVAELVSQMAVKAMEDVQQVVVTV